MDDKNDAASGNKENLRQFAATNEEANGRMKGGQEDLESSENQGKSYPYPKAIFFLLTSELSNILAVNGRGTIYTLYLTRFVGLSEDNATMIFHIYPFVKAMVGIIGAICADSWMGRYKCILFFSLIVLSSSLLLTLTAMPPIPFPVLAFTILSLLLSASGGGFVDPNVIPFHGDQFILPEQENKLEKYFSIFYLGVNIVAALAMLILPILRAEVRCFGENECYSLPFAVSHFLEVFSYVTFLSGSKFYIKKPPAGDIIFEACRIIRTSIVTKWEQGKTNPREHWLDYADEKHSKQLIEDMKVFFRILVLFIPVPIFWTLFHQQGSRWTLQAARMDGQIGSWDIKPDQMRLLNPLLILIFIPLFDYCIYPALKFVGIQRPLQKLVSGALLAGIAFIIAGMLELKLQKTNPTLPSSANAQLRIFNGESCGYTFTTNIKGKERFSVDALGFYVYKDIDVVEGDFKLAYQITPSRPNEPDCPAFNPGTFDMKENTAYSLFMSSKHPNGPLKWYKDDIRKPQRGNPKARILANIKPGRKITWMSARTKKVKFEEIAYRSQLNEFSSGRYRILIDGVKITETFLKMGGVYTVLVNEKKEKEFQVEIFEITAPNTVHMIWQTPQYVVLTLGEVMFAVTGLQFFYMQAPLSMKSLVRASYLLAMGIGNMFVAVIAKAKIVKTQALEFFLFAGVMFVDVFILMILAYFYKPNNPVENQTESS